ncbi:unnamed protein product [Schistosoma curassoni]|uniref:Aa_trans domain-containing protein n=1 Tax=Schistosoma curassoni TaxID=6186 RepID=A0A183K8F5_9TREM|nr:unnamed protein product [Schistosoma curassoni]
MSSCEHLSMDNHHYNHNPNELYTLEVQSIEIVDKLSNHITEEKLIKRDYWKGKIDFLIACLGFSIGLGAFLIPYFISVFLAGIPLFLLEVTVGQVTRRGVIAAWNICPLFQGKL